MLVQPENPDWDEQTGYLAHEVRYAVMSYRCLQTHLDSHKLRDFAIRCFDGGHSQQVPEGCAILSVVQQSAGHRLALPDSIPNLRHLLGVSSLPLQESAERSREGGDSTYGSVVIKRIPHTLGVPIFKTQALANLRLAQATLESRSPCLCSLYTFCGLSPQGVLRVQTIQNRTATKAPHVKVCFCGTQSAQGRYPDSAQ